MFKVNNKDTKTMSLTYFTPFSTVDSKQVNLRDTFFFDCTKTAIFDASTTIHYIVVQIQPILITDK